MNKFILLLFFIFSVQTAFSQALPDIPIDFDDPSVNYNLGPFGSNTSAVLGADPMDPANSVVCITKLPGADCWAGVTIGAACLANPFPFAAGNMTIYVDVYSPEIGTPILVKVENCGNGGISSEVLVVTTAANAWETLAFDFSNGCPSAPNLANTYDKISIFPQFTCDPDACGNANPGTAPSTTDSYYFDDISMVAPVLNAPSIPITFGDLGTDYNLAPFSSNNTMSAVVGADPTDPNNPVLCATKLPGADCWAGVTVGGSSNSCLSAPVDFSMGTTITMDVYSPVAGTPMLLKFENCTNGGISTEVIAVSTVANAWETLTFDFSMGCANPPNPANVYDKMSVFPRFTCDPDACGNPNPGAGVAESTMAYYFDNIQQTLAPTTAEIEFCVDMTCLPSVQVPSVYGTFTTPPWNAGQYFLADGDGDGIWCATVTVPAGMHQYKFFDQIQGPEEFDTFIAGCHVLDGANINRTLTVVAGVDQSLTFGWNSCDATCTPPPPRPDLKITFDDPLVDYNLAEFGGVINSSIVTNPDPVLNDNVLTATKPAGAQCWGGTVVGDGGLENPIPFTATEQRMVMQVWSPYVGAPILLKVEDANNAAIASEVLALTTVANQWELLVFDFANGAPAINLANTYSKVVVFTEFWCNGGSGTNQAFYYDNINFYTEPTVELTCPPTAQVAGCGAVDAPPFADFAAFMAAGGSVVDGNELTFKLINTTESGTCPVIIEHEYEITDFCGWKDSCTHITEVAAPGPTVTCPPDQVVSCFEDIVVDPNDLVVQTSCGSTFTAYIKQPTISGGLPGCDGTVYTYIYKAVDACGNVAECEQQFMIQNSAPMVTVPAGATVTCFDEIEVSVDDVTVTGGCEGENTINVLPPVVNGPANCTGTTYTYTYRVRDFCNRIVEVDRVFTISNQVGPIITSIPLDMTSECGGGPNLQLFLAESNCGGDDDIEYTVSDPVVIGTPGCSGSRIEYTYTATDACGRVASHVQRITIQNDGPVVDCPETLQIFGCQDGDTDDIIQAWLASVTATGACGESLTVNNNFNGNPGMCLGNGFTNVTFFATDQCGRTRTCVGTIAIIDTDAPIIYQDPQEMLVPCNGVTQDIFNDWLANNGGAEAIDECWGNSISWSTNPSNPQLNCAGGPQAILVEFIASDGCGNTASVTGVFNTKMQPDMVAVSGSVERENTDPVANVQIGVFGGSAGVPNMDYTETSGGYGLPEIEYEDNLSIVPEKNDDPLNGVTTHDLILLQQHILSIINLDSPYKRIAADVNRSGSISTFDLVLLRRLILFVDDEFTNNTSWRFVESDFVFPNEDNPFEAAFPEVYMLEGNEEEQANFVGVKIGDLNLDAITNELMGDADDRTGLDDLVFDVKDQSLVEGEEYAIDFTVQNFNQINGFQFTMNFDQEVFEFIELQGADLVDFDAKNYGTNKLENGALTVSWNYERFVDLKPEDVAFSLVVVAKSDAQLSDVLSISSEYTRAEAYQSGDLMNVDLAFEGNGNINTSQTFKLFQNQPNPFKNVTMIGFNLPETGMVSLEVYDVSGRLIHKTEREFAEGYNQFNLDRSDLPSTGILYYQVNTKTDSDSKKMILLN